MCPTELLAHWLQIHREFVEPLVVLGFPVLRSLAESNTFTKRLLNLRDFSSLCQKSFAKKYGNGTAAEEMQKFFKTKTLRELSDLSNPLPIKFKRSL